MTRALPTGTATLWTAASCWIQIVRVCAHDFGGRRNLVFGVLVGAKLHGKLFFAYVDILRSILLTTLDGKDFRNLGYKRQERHRLRHLISKGETVLVNLSESSSAMEMPPDDVNRLWLFIFFPGFGLVNSSYVFCATFEDAVQSILLAWHSIHYVLLFRAWRNLRLIRALARGSVQKLVGLVLVGLCICHIVLEQKSRKRRNGVKRRRTTGCLHQS